MLRLKVFIDKKQKCLTAELVRPILLTHSPEVSLNGFDLKCIFLL